MKFNEISKIYCEHPDVDVLELKDGTLIGITDETICLYPKDSLFDENFSAIYREDLREPAVQEEFLCVWERVIRAQKNQKPIMKVSLVRRMDFLKER